MYSLVDRAYNPNLKFVIAIDGTSASGKGTIAHALSEKFHMSYFASSVIYRKLASMCYSNNVEDIDAIIALSYRYELLNSYNPNDLYDEHITTLCSQISSIPEVRENLRPSQRALIDQNLRVILDGRDIGTVIAPDAHLKLFINANLQERAKRRYEQLQKNNVSCNMEHILQNLSMRDERDAKRSVAPLKIATDAYVIDNTGTQQNTIAAVLQIINDAAAVVKNEKVRKI